MTLHPLKPRLNSSDVVRTAEIVVAPSRKDWELRYAEIERLYVHERRRLRYVMQYMECEHDFRATSQAYKKRLAKWGFSKNAKRNRPVPRTSTPSTSSEDHEDHADHTTTPLPQLVEPKRKSSLSTVSVRRGIWTNSEQLVLEVLINVRDWGREFFESDQTKDLELATAVSGGLLPWEENPQIEKAKAINYNFTLVINLLNRGHGAMAGRVARKAFLQIENMIWLGAPALLWNVLDLLHYILVSGHSKLFRLFLTHVWALVKEKKSPSHPVYIVMHCLVRLVANSFACNVHDLHCRTTEAIAEPRLESLVLLSVLERAWKINAEIVFDTLDPRFFNVYCCMSWDATSIPPPTAIFRAAKPWLDKRRSLAATAWNKGTFEAESDIFASNYTKQPPAEDKVLYGELVRDGRWLYERTIESIYDRGQSIVDIENGGEIVLLRILAGLVSADVMERYVDDLKLKAATEGLGDGLVPPEIGVAACMIRLMMEVDDEVICSQNPSVDAIKRLKRLVSIRSLTLGETHPKVIQELLLLEEALSKAGERADARMIRQRILNRLEVYVQDIPVNSA